MLVRGKPDWLKVKAPTGERFAEVRELTKRMDLMTICDSSHCPNISDCWSRGHVTFLILGRRCTRRCAFCAVEQGPPEPPDAEEPERIADAVSELALRNVVITSVTRDDLPDQGAGQYRAVVEAVRATSPEARIELLIPDMGSSSQDIGTIIEAGPDVMGHNIETVRRLQTVRDRRSSYDVSLETLRTIKRLDPSMMTKSSLMLGLGEAYQEVVEALWDLRAAGTDLVAIGQYLRPRNGRLEVQEYVPPETFRRLAEEAKDMGFLRVASAPLIRSSYYADEGASKETDSC
ncbi:MAG: lipoyl synthase [Methanomassiliicoccales archaeon PtaB.Bin134]|nr:MAG: lipoyl synthase [Methanomassiliicoccales archaeon PtaB.Bin134]